MPFLQSQTAVTGEPNWGAAVFLFVLAFASTLMLFSLDEGYERCAVLGNA